MSFLYPSFLWALALLAIPVLIHLFNFRRYKRIVFPNVRMLQQIQQQTKTGNKLKKYLILASRLLALGFLILAFAQPFIPKNQGRQALGKKRISILIDNSFSMNLSGDEGPLLEAAKNRARAIVNASGNSDEFSIVTSDLNAGMLHFSSKQTALEHIDKIKISSNALPFRNLLEQQNNSLADFSGPRYAYCISDFQAINSKLDKKPYDSSIHTGWMQLTAAGSDNLSVDSCFLLSPVLQAGQAITLVCRVSNYTDKPVTGSTLELWIDGKPKGVASFDIGPMGSETRNLVFSVESGGIHNCELRLPGDNIPLDDILYFSLSINKTYQVACISKASERYADAVFSDNPGFIYKAENSGNITYSDFKKRDMIVLQSAGEISSGFASELGKFVNAGGTLLIFPDKDLKNGGLSIPGTLMGFSLSETATMQAQRVSRIDLEHPVFSHIFEKKTLKPELPQVAAAFSISARNAISMMQVADGQAFLSDIRYGKGHVILCAAPLDQAYSNLQNHALFVPLLLRSAMMAAYRFPLYYRCSERSDIYTGLPFESETGISLKGSKTAVMPEAVNREGELYINTNGEIDIAGHYGLFNRNSDTAIQTMSFNFDRSESDTRVLNETEFEKTCSDYGIETYSGSAEQLGAGLSKTTKGSLLWKWCILFSLLCLLIEILLIRFFRNNVSITA